MRDISIFAGPAKYTKTAASPYPHIYRASSLIRGEQIAKQLGARLNPKSGYEKDLCIYVKGRNWMDMPSGSYVDILDDAFARVRMRARPDVGMIAASTPTYKIIAKDARWKSALIPQHHCNFDREVRERRPVKVVGYIGSMSAFSLPVDEIRARLGKLGLEFVTSFSYRSREDVVEFYRGIDIQICWDEADTVWRQPLKLINAASFGIPTIANRHVGWAEFERHYFPVQSPSELMWEVQFLRDTNLFNPISERLVMEAEEYHIENVAELYKELR